MGYSQLYSMLNVINKESFGAQAPVVKDTTSFISLGDVILSSETNVTMWYSALQKKITRILIAQRKGIGKKRRVRRDDMAWGAFIEKVHFKPTSMQTNSSWSTSDHNPYTGASYVEAKATIFGDSIGTFQSKMKYPVYQMYQAFRGEAQMQAFITGMIERVEIDVEVAWNNLDILCECTNIAVALNSAVAGQKINVLYEMNKFLNKTGQNRITVEAARSNKEFYRFFAALLDKLTHYLANERSVEYNAGGFDKIVPKEYQVVEVLKDMATNAQYYLDADTYHNQLVSLPGYEEVDYWQTPGVHNKAFEDISKINIIHDYFKDADTNPTGQVTQDGILAFIHDVESCASIIHRERDYSLFNPEDEHMIMWKKGDQEYMVDPAEDAIVLFMSDDFVELDHHTATVTAAAGDSHTASLTASAPDGVTVSWKSSDTTTATVSSGTVTGVAAGTAVITAYYNVNGVVYSDTCTVTVS